MNELKIMSRSKAKQYSALKIIPTSVIISIHSCEGIPNRFFNNPQIKSVCHWEFDDTEDDDYGITEKQANQIADFVKRWIDKVDTIIVHCDAGISRSAGVGAAILYWKFGNDDQIFDDGTYTPNMRCYRKMMKAFGLETGFSFENTLEEKMKTNLSAWKEINKE